MGCEGLIIMEGAAIIPLFERLIDDNQDELFEKNTKRISTFREFQESILRDLSRLLNTRVSVSWKNYPSKITIPYSYGVNVTAPMSVENVFEIRELESRIDDVIRKFEPRLINAKSQVVGVGSGPSGVFVNIEAIVNIENRKTPLSFPIVIDA
ncbi:MAG: type VI secretion system baseplate subunit TssE [Holosporaceae bacterium]|jgi:type VI secretion system lysozyme-like protein|nr:type VI secretion system baseplate subunit TssE [Holosporaceae bacterium]